jgi:uncharacterized membrane protein YbaN (DUF454 family)
MKVLPSPRVRVVHASVGRLRVHQPDPDGRLVGRLTRLPGVISAEVGKWTGNILILFDPLLTSAEVLLDELERPSLPSPAVAPSPPVLEQQPQAVAVQPTMYVTGTRARVYKALGWASVGMAIVGILPGIPTVPFVALAGYFFIRSSPAAHDWLQQSSWFGPILRDWEKHRAVSRSVKRSAVGLMALGLAVSWLMQLPPAILGTIVVLEIVGLAVVMRLPEAPTAPDHAGVGVTAKASELSIARF